MDNWTLRALRADGSGRAPHSVATRHATPASCSPPEGAPARRSSPRCRRSPCATGAVNLGQGFPDTDGPAEIAEAAIDAIRAGHNQYPPGIGIPELRHAIADASAPLLRHRLRPRRRGAGHRRRDRSDRRALLALCDPGDEVITFEPYYDSYAAVHRDGRRAAPIVTLRPPDYRFDADALRAPRSRRGPGCVLLNSPHNPTGKVFTRAELDADRRGLRRARPAGRHRRGLRAPGLRRRARAAGHAAGHARAHAHDLVGRQDVLVHGMEDRLGCGAGRPRRGGAHREAVPHLRQRRAVPARGRDRARAGRRRAIAGLAADLARPSATSSAPGSPTPGFTVFRPPGTYFVTTDVRVAGRRRRARVLPARCPSAAAWSRSRTWSSTTTWKRAARRALHVLQAPRGPRRGARAI